MGVDLLNPISSNFFVMNYEYTELGISPKTKFIVPYICIYRITFNKKLFRSLIHSSFSSINYISHTYKKEVYRLWALFHTNYSRSAQHPIWSYIFIQNLHVSQHNSTKHQSEYFSHNKKNCFIHNNFLWFYSRPTNTQFFLTAQLSDFR